MTTRSFTKAIAASSRLPVYLLHARDEAHGACWYYIEVDAAKHAKFRKMLEGGEPFDLSAFGRIIDSGWGEQPPQITVDFLRDEGVIDKDAAS